MTYHTLFGLIVMQLFPKQCFVLAIPHASTLGCVLSR